jgi:hypothetical protein
MSIDSPGFHVAFSIIFRSSMSYNIRSQEHKRTKIDLIANHTVSFTILVFTENMTAICKCSKLAVTCINMFDDTRLKNTEDLLFCEFLLGYQDADNGCDTVCCLLVAITRLYARLRVRATVAQRRAT